MNEMPEKLIHPFFNDMKLPHDEWLPFYHEQQYYTGNSVAEPWKNSEQYIAMILSQWDDVQKQIRHAHQQRDKQAAQELMTLGVAYLVQYVYWLNEEPVSLDGNQIGEKLAVVPFNFVDRLQFIMQQPALHLAFLQLVELMNELKKLYAKQMIRKKHSKQ